METEDRMAASIPGRRIPLVCTDLIIPSPQPASQSGDERGAESPERQDLIGDGQTDWMTEKVDLSSFLSTTESSPSSSLPPSPLEQDVKVPSDLEVMTSLLQEELAQLEDYFRSESSTKPDKPSRCERGAQAMGAQSYYQLPYTSSYSTSQSETSPVVVTLATGELDLAGFCGGPVGRPKMARPAPYSYHRYHSNGRRTVPESVKVGQEVGHEAWSPKGSYSGSAENLCSSLRSGGKSFCGVKKVRECSLSLKEEESYCFSEGMFCSEEIARGFCVGSSFESHKRDGQLTHNQKVNGSYDAAGLEVLHCNKDGGLPGGGAVPVLPPGGEGYFHQPLAAPEPYHSFIAELEQPPQAHALEPPHAHYLYPECLSDQSYECLSRGGGEGPMLGGLVQRPAPRLKDDPLKPALLATPPPEAQTGERKQKKRDQNKTAAHRYRVRKRAELDCLEEELHGLEGQNRELRDKAESVEREIQYVKDLLIEVYKARSQRLKQDGSA